jgi:chemotaxis protein MotB
VKFSDKNNSNSDQNFWVSYADLMAGLLFVFILLIGSIIVKYVLTQSDLETMKANLVKEREALAMSNEELSKKKEILNSLRDELKKSQEEGMHLSFKIASLTELLSMAQNDLNVTKAQLIASQDGEKAKADEVASLLISLNSLKEEQGAANEALKLNQYEIDQLKKILLDYEGTNKSLNNELQYTKESLEKKEIMLQLSQEELVLLEKKFIAQTTKYQKIADDLNITKARIRSLTGIKLKVAALLKKELGNSIEIDPKSGAIRFSSNILFNQGQYELKEDSKKELRQILHKYISTLFENPEIKQHIESIVIEGHTNTDGEYLFNLDLSQKRALEVMKFLFSLDFNNELELKRYVSASGKSYSETILKNGEEDKNASRRIEIKFRIKNEKAIEELDKFISVQ